MKKHQSKCISGVVVRPVQTHTDDRGFFRELWRCDQPDLPSQVAQTSITMSHPGVIKAFHGHAKQDDIWYVASGSARVVLVDRRSGSTTNGLVQTIVCGEDAPCVIVIPRGVYHGYQVLGRRPVVLVYHVTKPYDPKHPDELRLSWDDPSIGYDWTVKNR